MLCVYTAVSLYLYLLLSKYNIFPPQYHSNIIHLQVKLCSADLLMLCFSLNIRTKELSNNFCLETTSYIWKLIRKYLL